MSYLNNWELVTATPAKNSKGIFLSATDNTFIITDLSSSVEKKISRDSLVGNLKYPCEILCILQKEIHGFENKDKYYNKEAFNLITEICEANRLLF